MSVSIEIKGIPEVKNFLNKKKLKIDRKIPIGLKNASLHVQNEVKLSIAGRKPEPRSVDTGRFLNSVDINSGKDYTIVFSDIPYAKFLEYGTSRFKARRHFNNTKDREKSNVKKLIDKEIKEAVKSI